MSSRYNPIIVAAKRRMTYYIILFFTTFTAFVYEITIVRFFAVLFVHHYVFLAISVAMLGFGIGGLIVSLYNLNDKELEKILAIYSFTFFIPLLLPNLIPILMVHPLILSIVFIPTFLFASIIVCVFFKENIASTNFVYYANLAGAAFGSLLGVLFLSLFRPTQVLILCSVIVLLLNLIRTRKIIYLFFLSLIVIIFLLIGIHYNFVDIPISKAPYISEGKELAKLIKETSAIVEKTYWNSAFRTDIVSYPNNEQCKAIFVDGGAPSVMFKTDRNLSNLTWLKGTINYLPFTFVPPYSDLLSIGPGGGLDIILGKLANFKNIYAVEINPAIPKVLRDYKDYNGNIINLPELSFKISEGRTYLSAQNRSYDLILLSLSLTNTSAKIGHPFTECYLHTLEAYIEYYHNLKQSGMIAVLCETEPFLLRTLLTINQALVRCGINISEAHKHLAVVENFLPDSPYRYLIMFFADPISESKALAVRKEYQSRCLHIKFLPYFEEKLPIKFDNIQQMEDFIKKIRKECSLNVAPVNDEKPFFYDFGMKIPGSFIWLLLVSALCALVLLVFLKRQHKATLISNFYLLGIGYMVIEVAIIQKFIYLFGNPSLVFAFILFIFLIASGIGGLTSKNKNVWTKIAVLILPLLLLGTYGFINELINYLRQTSELMKFFVSGTVMFFLGYLMGKPFPLSLSAIGETNKINIGIIYGINGLMSVCGSILAMICARFLGFKYLFLIGFFIYLLIWLNMELSGIFQDKK